MRLQKMCAIVGVICTLFLSALAQETDVFVTIAQGDVAGTKAIDGEYFEFHGIPYADSTSGRNRFKAPSPPPLFSDVFVANRRDVKCVRALGTGYDGTEDCLVANIFTPSINTVELLPVMVWIKGQGVDQVKAPDLPFNNFMQKDVVVVSLNHRESILGFLCLGTETAPGNAGLKDIIAGLKWVRQNIIQFGGDPDNINLLGLDSGAAKVDLVSLSPKSEGLIKRVIVQSGNSLSPWAVARDNIKHVVDIAQALGHEITNIAQLSEVITETSIANLMAVINDLKLMDNPLAFAPCIENGSLENSDPFLLKSPYEILMKGKYTSLPFMVGFVDKNEAAETPQEDRFEIMDSSFIKFIKSELKFENADQDLDMTSEIKHFYFDNQPVDESTINEFLLNHRDTMNLVSILREAYMRASTSNSDIYLYQFSYKGSFGEPFTDPLPVEKVAHSEELAYWFRDFTNSNANKIDLAFNDVLIERWTNFAKTGRPFSGTSQVQWQPFTRDNFAYMTIFDSEDVNSQEEGSFRIDLERPHPKILTFWEQIYEENFIDVDRAKESHGKGNKDWNDERIVEGSGEGDDNGDVEGSGEEDDNGEVGGSGEEDIIDDGEGSGNEDGEDKETDKENGNGSATTAVSYPFLIIFLFGVLRNLCLA